MLTCSFFMRDTLNGQCHKKICKAEAVGNGPRPAMAAKTYFVSWVEIVFHFYFLCHDDVWSHIYIFIHFDNFILRLLCYARKTVFIIKKARFLWRANIIHLRMKLVHAYCRLPFHHQNLFIDMIQIYALNFKKQIYFSLFLYFTVITCLL